MLSKNIQLLRNWLQIGQGGLAESLGVSVNTVSNWENGTNPQPSRVRDLCAFFNSRIDGLDLTDDILLRGDVRERLQARRAIPEPIAGYPDEPISEGLRELLADEKTMLLMNITEAEVAILRGIRFATGQYQPTKGFYIDVLFDLRKSKEG